MMRFVIYLFDVALGHQHMALYCMVQLVVLDHVISPLPHALAAHGKLANISLISHRREIPNICVPIDYM